MKGIDDLTKEEIYQMFQDKLAELNEANKEIINIKARALKVHEENTKLKASSEYAAKSAQLEYFTEFARKVKAAGMFTNMNIDKIVIILKAGYEMGLKEMESLNGLYMPRNTVEIYGKLLVSTITEAGYTLSYEENKESCKVIAKKDKQLISELAHIDDPILQQSKAMKISKRNKLRFHALRLLLNFQLAHLIKSSSDLFEGVHMEAMKDENGNTKINSNIEILDLLKNCETIEQLQQVYETNKKQITKDIHLVSLYNKKLNEKQ